MKGRILFEEEQGFVGTWSWYLLLTFSLLSIIPMVIMMFLNESTNEALVGLGIVTLVMGTIIVVLAISRLYLTIDSTSIYYRFPPFVNSERRINKADISTVKVRTYKAIWEYGGYGYRYRLRSGKAYIVAGNEGVQLVFNNNKRLLIGTQKSEALSKALKQLQDHWKNPENNG